MKFIRYGNLNKSDYKNSGVNGDPYNYPPKRYGIFAFPYCKIELFMITWKYSKKVLKMTSEYLKEHNLPENYWEIDNVKYDLIKNKIWKKVMSKDRKVFIYDKPIWHHFIDYSVSKYYKGYWALDEMSDYEKILTKSIGIDKKFLERNGFRICRDVYEVFIDKKI
jgi:hypothetical protein